MGRKPKYSKGQYNMTDDFTGFKKKSGELRGDYYGYMVDDKGFEVRHPQETLRVLPELNKVRTVRKETDVFLEANDVSRGDL